MKRFTTLTALLAAALMTFTFIGCTEDDDIADTLWGVWEGDMHVWSEWDGEVYTAYETEIGFDRDPYTYASGTGYWVDYYSGAPWDYFASHITWTVSNGTIRIYSEEDNTYFYIYNYSLSDNYFTGTIESEWGDPMDFRLRKTFSPDWIGSDWGWGYSDDWYWDFNYSSPNRPDKQTRLKDASEIKPVRHIGAKPEYAE